MGVSGAVHGGMEMGVELGEMGGGGVTGQRYLEGCKRKEAKTMGGGEGERKL